MDPITNPVAATIERLKAALFVCPSCGVTIMGDKIRLLPGETIEFDGLNPRFPCRLCPNSVFEIIDAPKAKKKKSR